MKRKILVLTMLFILLIGLNGVLLANPLSESPEERGFYTWPEFRNEFPAEEEKLNEFLPIVQEEAAPVSVELDEPLEIAWLGPTIEVSDAWARLNKTIRGRLDDLNIPFNMTEFIIHGDEHDRQASQIQQVLAGDYDYVVIGPSEYMVQKSNLEVLAKEYPTLIMNVVNPFVGTYDTEVSPLTHVGFDHSVGAEAIGDWVIKETNGEGTIGLLRYLPGLIDTLRSDHFADYVEKNSNLKVVDDFEADGKQDLGYSGANSLLSKNPELTMLHSGSTAVALGALAAVEERGMVDDIILNGWGGGQDELDAIKEDRLDVTAFRVNDDWGVSVAEAIKLHLEGREEEIPYVVCATIEVVHKHMSDEEIDDKTDYAFRYSGQIDRGDRTHD